MKLNNKSFIKIELILIMIYVFSNIIIRIVPDTSNYGLGAIFTYELWVTIIVALTTFYLLYAIIIVALIMTIFNIVQLTKKKDIKKPIKYTLLISLIMIAIGLIITILLI